MYSLGDVSNRGPEPAVGERILPADGGAHYVVTFVLQVVRAELLTAPPPRHRRHARERTPDARPSPIQRAGPEPLLAAPQHHRPLDLFARLVGGQPSIGDVRIALGGEADWRSGRDAGVSLSTADVAIANDVRAGDVVACQVSLYAPDDAVGQLGGSIQFFLR